MVFNTAATDTENKILPRLVATCEPLDEFTLLLVVAGGIACPLGLVAMPLVDAIGTLADDKGTDAELDHGATDEGVADRTDVTT